MACSYTAACRPSSSGTNFCVLLTVTSVHFTVGLEGAHFWQGTSSPFSVRASRVSIGSHSAEAGDMGMRERANAMSSKIRFDFLRFNSIKSPLFRSHSSNSLSVVDNGT